MISILILTKNEEQNLPSCLRSVPWCDDVVVFDSFSEDGTVELAKAAGARVVQRPFDNYAAHRGAALSGLEYRYPWVLMLDADECVSPELAAEIRTFAVEAPQDITLGRMRRKDMLMGRWLRRSSGYPTWFGRLVRPGQVRVEREINEEYHTEGRIHHFQEHLVHFPFNKGMDYWLDRHNRYSTMEARTLQEERHAPISWPGLFSRDPVARRKHLKQLAYRMPGRPFLVFCYLYFLRLGLLDGRAGLTFCALRGIYEHMIDVKCRELWRRKQALPV